MLPSYIEGFSNIVLEIADFEEFSIHDVSHIVLDIDCIQVYLDDVENNNIPYEYKYFG